jgi:hypothetical protein
MQFQITKIDFDLDSDDLIEQPNLQESLQEEYVGQIWEADDEDDLVEEITCATGWCIKSIDYRHIFN